MHNRVKIPWYENKCPFTAYIRERKGICMSDRKRFYIVDKDALPEIFHSVVEAKKLLKTGEAETVNEAVKKVGISRSAFYKYKDAVWPFAEGDRGKIITLFMTLQDIPGVLSDILNEIAETGSNILTINQNIPIHGVANVTISIDTKDINVEQEILLDRLSNHKNVNKIEIIAQE